MRGLGECRRCVVQYGPREPDLAFGDSDLPLDLAFGVTDIRFTA